MSEAVEVFGVNCYTGTPQEIALKRILHETHLMISGRDGRGLAVETQHLPEVIRGIALEALSSSHDPTTDNWACLIPGCTLDH